MVAKLNAHHERMMVRMDLQLEKIEAAPDKFEEILKKMDITNLDASQEKSEAVAEQQNVPKEEAAMENIRALKKRYTDRHLASGRLREPKKRTQSDGDS
jgi:hypothetical protein